MGVDINYSAALPAVIPAMNTPAVNVSDWMQQIRGNVSALAKKLFASNEQGFMLDYGDYSTLYQDAAGTTPVTAAAQPMGLVLDKSKGLTLGVELLPPVANKSLWSVIGSPTYGSVTVDGTSVIFSSNTGGVLAYTTGSFSSSKMYKFSITVAEITGALYLENAEAGGAIRIDNPGTYTCVARNVSKFYFRNSGTGSAITARITAASAKEIVGNHAYQATASMRPILRDNPRRVDYDGIDDKLLVNLPSTLTNCTVVRATAFAGVEVDTDVTITSPMTLNTDACASLVINRALTPKELSDVKIAFEQLLRVSRVKYLIQSMFANGEVGFAYDINDLSTLYQDAAGTIPVTGAGQPVGLIKDKSGRGNHAYQTTSASRPILRQSPILGSELVVNGGFDSDTTWSKGVGWTIAGGKSTASNASSILSQLLPVVSGKKYLASFTVSDYVSGALQIRSGSTTITYFSKNGTFVGEFTAEGTANLEFVATSLNASIDNVTIKEITSYYTYRNYLEFDGVDDFLVTNSIDFTTTDKVSLFAGVRKLSDVTRGLLVHTGSTEPTPGVRGNFDLEAPSFELKGYSATLPAAGGNIDAKDSNTLSPHSAVLSVKYWQGSPSISSAITLKVNTVLMPNFGGGSLLQGKFSKLPMYIGRRGGIVFPFSGHIYSLIGIGRLTTDFETNQLEQALSKTVGVNF